MRGLAALFIRPLRRDLQTIELVGSQASMPQYAPQRASGHLSASGRHRNTGAVGSVFGELDVVTC